MAPRVPDKVLEQMTQTAKLLKQPAVAPRQEKLVGFNVDFDAVATDLETGIPELRASISNLDGARKQAEGTLVAKQEATKAFRRTVLPSIQSRANGGRSRVRRPPSARMSADSRPIGCCQGTDSPTCPPGGER